MRLKNITKKYGDKIVYDNFSFDFEENKITAVLGESGSGKTTLLKIIASLTDYTGETEKPSDKTSFIFQENRLIPNLTVKENLSLVCKNQDLSFALEKAGLKEAQNLYPKSLSAGMSRRVAVLRGLLYAAPLVLMDEPFTNLDVALKYSLMDMVKETQKNSKKTMIFVTHDIAEATYLADKIAVIAHGKIVKQINEITPETQNELLMFMMNIGSVN